MTTFKFAPISPSSNSIIGKLVFVSWLIVQQIQRNNQISRWNRVIALARARESFWSWKLTLFNTYLSPMSRQDTILREPETIYLKRTWHKLIGRILLPILAKFEITILTQLIIAKWCNNDCAIKISKLHFKYLNPFFKELFCL